MTTPFDLMAARLNQARLDMMARLNNDLFRLERPLLFAHFTRPIVRWWHQPLRRMQAYVLHIGRAIAGQACSSEEEW